MGNPVGISSIRTVPVGEDLTTNDLALNVLRGMELANRVDLTLAPGVSLVTGEWAVLNSSELAVRATGTPVATSYPVFAGTERFDVAGTGQVTVLMGPPGLVIQSSFFDTTASYAIGSPLTIKAVSGSSSPTLASGSDPVVARVVEVGASNSYLTYQLLAP